MSEWSDSDSAIIYLFSTKVSSPRVLLTSQRVEKLKVLDLPPDKKSGACVEAFRLGVDSAQFYRQLFRY